MRRTSSVNVHELERWLERHKADLIRDEITSALGRGPTLGSRQGATWISFQSKHALARIVLTHAGDCHLTASGIGDGIERMNSHEEFSSSVRLDDALADLVGQLL